MDLEKIKEFQDLQAVNADKQKQDDNHEELVGSLNNLLMATMVGKDPKMAEVAANLSDLLIEIGKASATFKGSSLHLLPYSNNQLATAVVQLKQKVEDLSEAHNLKPYFEKLNAAVLRMSDRQPVVNVPKTELNFKPVVDAIKAQSNKEDPNVFDDFKAQDITGDDSFQYVGFVDPKGRWYIIENDISGGSLRYKFGKKNYATAWKNHSGQSYKLLNEAISEIQT